LTLTIDIALLSLRLLTPLLCNGSRDLSREIFNLLTKISKGLALSQLIQALS
jgi:hypothetical protein